MMQHKIERNAWVPYSPTQMYDLVNQVESYPEFLPGCVEGHIIQQTPTEMTASLSFAGKGLHKTLTTRNTLDKPHAITLALVNGPFKHLQGLWTFQPLDTDPEKPQNAQTGCHITLTLAFELNNALLSRLFGHFFIGLADRLVALFCERADLIYGSDA